MDWSLPCGLSPCPSDFDCCQAAASTERLCEEFPAYGSVLLRLAIPNLRTVIVTAAVHRGFSSKLLPPCGRMTSLFNLPAPGRRQPLYVVFDFAETCVFVKQSQSAFHCGPLGL